MKHTPGKWKARDLDIVHAEKGRDPVTNSRSLLIGYAVMVGNNHGMWIGIDNKEAKANATLMAAAPDLLSACQYVVDWHREHDNGEGELFGLDFVTTCIAAIRKATA